MRGLLKNTLLNLVNVKIQNVKKIRIIINIGIFLSIFAISASIITIYFQSKIDKIDKTILDNQQLLEISEYNLALMPAGIEYQSRNRIAAKKEKLFTRLNWFSNQEIFNERHIYYSNFL